MSGGFIRSVYGHSKASIKRGKMFHCILTIGSLKLCLRHARVWRPVVAWFFPLEDLMVLGLALRVSQMVEY